MKKTIALNTIAQIAGKIISGGTTFLVSIILARSLGVEGYGDFTKITTYIAFFYLFCDFGLNAAYLQLVSKTNEQQIKNTLFTTRLLIGLVMMFITLAITALLPGTDTQGYSMVVKMGIILFVPSILFQSMITTTNVLFQERLRYDYATYAITAGSVVTLISLYIGSKLFLPTAFLFGSVFALLSGSAATAAVALLFVKQFTITLHLVWNVNVMKQLLLLALPLGLTLLSNVVYFHADSVILTISRSTAEVGVYGLAYKLFEVLLVIPTFFMNTMFPLFIAAKKSENTKQLKHQINTSGVLLVGTAVLFSISGWILAPYISLIRPEFLPSVLPLRMLLLGLPIFYLTSLFMWVLIVERKQKQLLSIYLSSMILNIGANIVLIPQYGYMAAALITIISESFVLLCSWITLKHA